MSPGSSADIERLFSSCGRTLNKLRSVLGRENFERLQLVKGNWDDKYYEKDQVEIDLKGSKAEETRKRMSEAQRLRHQRRRESIRRSLQQRRNNEEDRRRQTAGK